MQIYIPSKSSKIDLRCAKGSIPSVMFGKFQSIYFCLGYYPPKQYTLSPTHPGFTGSVWLQFSPYVLKPYSLSLLCVLRKAFVIQHISSTRCTRHYFRGWWHSRTLGSQLSGNFDAGKAVGWQSYWQLTREVSGWGTRGTMVPEILQVGDCLYGLPEATLHVSCGGVSHGTGKTPWPGEEGVG